MITGSIHEASNRRHFILISLLFSLLQSALGGCPSVCQCKWRDGKETVTCEDANFIDIPKGLDSSTQVLNLKKNRLIILPQGAFIETGLVNLQKVWMNNCQLRFMEKGAFKKLANLVELDLSGNYLNSVPSEALLDVAGLRNLYLSRNNLGDIPTAIFISVPSLVRLDISYNNISTINKYAFKSLSRLEVLKLSGNILHTLSVNVLKPLVALHGLHVDNNPWHCDCHLRLLRQWLLQRNVAASVPPKCQSPTRLQGRGWQSLGEDEFVCIPLLTAVAQRVLAAHGDNVSLACRVETDSNAAITWLVDDRPVINTSASTDHRYKVMELGVPKNDGKVSNLTIAGAAVQDQGIYRCVAENKAGRVETNLTLKVSQRIKETALIALDKVFVTGALLGSIAFIFIVSVISCAVLYDKNKRTRMSVKVVSSVNQSNLDLSFDDPNIQSSLRKVNLVDYQIVPTSETKILNEVKPESSCRDGSDSSLHRRDDDQSSMIRLDHMYSVKGASKKVSYLETPKVESCKDTDPLLKEIYRGTTFIQNNSLTSPPSSFNYFGNGFPDLLNLPKHLPSHIGSMDQLPFCTIPRRSKREERLLAAAADDSTLSLLYGSRVLKLSPEFDTNAPYRRRHRHSLFQTEELSKVGNILGREKVRWSSALSLDLSTATNDSPRSTHPPSLPSTPLSSRFLEFRNNQSTRREPLIDNIDKSSNLEFDSELRSSVRSSLPPPREKAKNNCQWDQPLQNSFDGQTICNEENKLIEEIRKLRARKEELSKLRPEEFSLDARLGGPSAPGARAKQFEYHAQQLDRFLQEYKSLQDQLYKMKESCEYMQTKKVYRNNPGKNSSSLCTNSSGLSNFSIAKQKRNQNYEAPKGVTMLLSDNILTTEKI